MVYFSERFLHRRHRTCPRRRGGTDWSGIRVSAETKTNCFCPVMQDDMKYGLFRRGKILGGKK